MAGIRATAGARGFAVAHGHVALLGEALVFADGDEFIGLTKLVFGQSKHSVVSVFQMLDAIVQGLIRLERCRIIFIDQSKYIRLVASQIVAFVMLELVLQA